MTVGIDGGALSITDDRLKVGVYRVASNLIKELPRIGVKSNYRIYGFKRGEEGMSGVRKRNVEFIRLPRPGFQKIWQSLELLVNPVTTYLGISQSLPFTLYDVYNIGFIYDTGFLDHPEFYRESYFSLVSQTNDVVRRSDHIITISRASYSSIRKQYNVPKEKLSVASLGVEKQFRPTGLKVRWQVPYFLFAGALKPGKNVPMMIRSFARFLAHTKVPHDFILAGSDYWPDPGISATINSLRLQDRVRCVGFVDDDTLAGYYRGATALVTVSMIEGFGLPAVEAMACGTPVIASDIGSYPEVIDSAGILCDPTDEAALAHAMQSICTNANLRNKLKEAGFRRAKQFTWSSFARHVFDISMQKSTIIHE